MRKLALLLAVTIAAHTSNTLAQIEPSSIKASVRLMQVLSCDTMNNCHGSGNVSFTGSMTFDLPTTAPGQFGPSTQVSVQTFYGLHTFQFSDDQKYEVGDESLKVTRNITDPTSDVTVGLKMSWKNGVCKLVVKGKGKLFNLGPPLNALNSLEPGNPANTTEMTINIFNGMTTLADVRGYFARQMQQTVSQKPLPNNGVQTTIKISAKSKYQVAKPLGTSS